MKSKRHRKRSTEKQSSWLLKRKLRIQRVWKFLQQENFSRIVLIIGIQKGKEGEVISNPPSEYKLSANDYLIVIAASEASGGLSKALSESSIFMVG